MGSQSSDIEFALVGHQDDWSKITRFVNWLNKGSRELTAAQVAEVYTYIPPRVVFDIEITSTTGQTSRGCYIETYISPDELGLRHWKKNVLKVKEAAQICRDLNAPIATLGGFTSIVLEGRDEILNENSFTKFTTGNSLTAAFIVKNMEKACIRFNKELERQTLLVIGATGDIGSACVNYFKGKVKKILMCARQDVLLQASKNAFLKAGYEADADTDLRRLLPQADLVIAIASSTIEHFDPALCKKDIIICDAGYPKNLVFDLKGAFAERLFCGGMGIVKGNFSFKPDIHHDFYDFPIKNIGHGCLQEAVLLAYEKQFVPYSTGRGNITTEKIEWIYQLARKHGMEESPFYNPLGAWDPK